MTPTPKDRETELPSKDEDLPPLRCGHTVFYTFDEVRQIQREAIERERTRRKLTEDEETAYHQGRTDGIALERARKVEMTFCEKYDVYSSWDGDNGSDLVDLVIAAYEAKRRQG